MIKILSFDLQGTLSDSKFSDHFWLELLPEKHSSKNRNKLEESKIELKKIFSRIGKYDSLYYDDSAWAEQLDFETLEVLEKSEIQPKLESKFYDFIQNTSLPSIIISTTTDLFIKYELGENIGLFKKTYSCIDYFNCGGKTKDIFLRVAEELKVKPSEILHIGDSVEMDIENAKKAGVMTILHQGNADSTIEKIKHHLKQQ